MARKQDARVYEREKNAFAIYFDDFITIVCIFFIALQLTLPLVCLFKWLLLFMFFFFLLAKTYTQWIYFPFTEFNFNFYGLKIFEIFFANRSNFQILPQINCHLPKNLQLSLKSTETKTFDTFKLLHNDFNLNTKSSCSSRVIQIDLSYHFLKEKLCHCLKQHHNFSWERDR